MWRSWSATIQIGAALTVPWARGAGRRATLVLSLPCAAVQSAPSSRVLRRVEGSHILASSCISPWVREKSKMPRSERRWLTLVLAVTATTSCCVTQRSATCALDLL